ncbi:MAG: hypothetical protein ABUL46_03950, partial [Chitinophaga rupis]
MNPSFDDLLQKFIREELSPEELQTFLALVREPSNQETIRDAIGRYLDAEDLPDLSAGVDSHLQFTQAMKKAGEMHIPGSPSIGRARPLYRRWWAAASIILVLAAGAYFWTRHSRQIQPVVLQQPANIGPGRQGAILTLADGTPVVLDSLGNGIVATQ